MNQNDIIQLLNQYADYNASVALVELQKQELIDTILTPEIKAKISEIDAEFAEKSQIAQLKCDELKEQIKTAIVSHGSSVKGDYFHAVYSAGRVKWNEKKLLDLASKMPEIITARETGDPSMTLRKI